MSGGKLVDVDRLGREIKYYKLSEGSATLGSDPACDIRFPLPKVGPHHATVVVHSMQTVVQAVSSEHETLVNGAPVSVAALRHGDVIALGGRALRWEYDDPAAERPLAPEPALGACGAGEGRAAREVRAARRGSQPARRPPPAPAPRASMPAATGGKQVAIVQPQRRDTSDFSDAASTGPRSEQSQASNGSGGYHTNAIEANGDRAKRRTAGSPRSGLSNLANTTKATLWIESRKSSPRKSIKTRTPVKTPTKRVAHAPSPSAVTRSKTPAKPSHRSPPTSARTPPEAPAAAVKTPVKSVTRKYVRKTVSAKKSTPLRMSVLRKAQSAHKPRVTKIQAPLKMDSTKQAAIMLMARHTPKSKQLSPKQGIKRPSYLVKKPSPVKKATKKPQTTHGGKKTPPMTPTRSTSLNPRGYSNSHRTPDTERYASHIEITDSGNMSSSMLIDGTQRSRIKGSPFLPSPKKSALKDPSAKANRKTESIKFDLSNLENLTYNRSSDVIMVDETTGHQSGSDDSASEYTLRYSDSSTSKSLATTSSLRIRGMEASLGTSTTDYPQFERSLTSDSQRSKKTLPRIQTVDEDSSKPEVFPTTRRILKGFNNESGNVVSSRNTRSATPRSRSNNLESYSVVDLVSNDSHDSYSNYNSAGSVSSYASYETPTLSSYDLRTTSTPDYGMRKNFARTRNRQLQTRKSKSKSGTFDLTNPDVTTPENTEDTTKSITFITTRMSRASKSRSRINDSDHIIEAEGKDSSPRSSKRIGVSQPSPYARQNSSINETSSNSPSIRTGTHTPENPRSPVEASTPVLNIQSLLDQHTSKPLNIDTANQLLTMATKNIGKLNSSSSKEGRTGLKSKTLNFDISLRRREIVINYDGPDDSAQNDKEVVTPKSAIKPVPEGVKNKHSSAKKPYSKRSLIDNLDESDIVKHLFNSPVKRKLSQSMTEFSRKQLFDEDDNDDDDDDVEDRARSTRDATHMTNITPNDSLMDNTEAYTPDVFVSSLNTSDDSPNMDGVKRLFQRNTPDNDLRNVRGVKALLRTPRPRRSIKNDVTNVTCVKAVFAKSSRNRLSNVRVKELFARSPRNDLRRVSGVKTLFQSTRRKNVSPRNELDDLRGVRKLFRPQYKSPRNDLMDVRGVKQMFTQGKQRNELSDLSGVERLFQDSGSRDSTFDRLVGRPPIRATYSKAKSFTVNTSDKKKNRKSKSKSLHDSTGQNTGNIREWLEKELKERAHEEVAAQPSTSKERKSTPNTVKNVSKMTLIRELQKLSTDTVDGGVTVISSRTRNSSIHKNEQSEQSLKKKSASELYGAHTLPIKKRSLVEASINRSSTDRHTRSNKLPIKKRAVIHSTPVKGRQNVTMNASEIGRMSPISSETTTIETLIRHLPPSEVFSKSKISFGKTQPSEELQVQTENTELPTKSTRLRKPTKTSPVQARGLRGRKSIVENLEIHNVKKRRSSIVITKKTPIPSPKRRVTRSRKSKSETEQQQVATVSPRKTRSTRGQKTLISGATELPVLKNARVIVRRSIAIVTKPSPQLKPRATKRTKNKEENSIQLKMKKNLKIIESNIADIKKKSGSPNISRNNKKKPLKSSDIPNTVNQSVSGVQTRRSRKIVSNDSAQTSNPNENKSVQSKRSRKVAKRGTENAQNDANENSALSNKRSTAKVVQPLTRSVSKKRGRQTKAEANVVLEATTKGKRQRTVLEDSIPKRVTRRQKSQEITTRANDKVRRIVEESASVITGRGRKRKLNEEEHATLPRDDPRMKIGNKKNEKQSKKPAKGNMTSRSGKGAGDARDKSPPELKSVKSSELGTRTRNAAQKPARGRKQVTTVSKSASKSSDVKKRTNIDVTDTKDNDNQPAKKARTSELAVASGTRSAARRATRSAAPPAARSAATRGSSKTRCATCPGSVGRRPV